MKIFFALLAFALSTNAFAVDSTIPAATSQTEESRFWPKDLYSDLFSNYHGSSLKKFDTSRSLDNKGKLGKPATTNFDSELALGYHVGEAVRVGAVVPFLAFPAPGATGDAFSLGDMGVKVSHSDTVNWRGVHVSTNLILQAPSSDYSRNRGQKLGIKTTPSLRYEFADSDFSLGAFNELKSYVGVNSGKAFKVWTLPYVKYRLNKSVALNLAYEVEVDHVAHSSARLSHYQHDLQPAVIWNVTKHFMVQPYMQFFSLSSISTAHTGFGTLISAAIL